MCMLKALIRYITVFFLTAAILLAALYFAARIPKEAIKEHALYSAEYLCGKEDFFNVIEGVDGSKIHYYADSILLNIAWSYDTYHPLKAVMLSAYFYSVNHGENENFLIAVRDKKEPNQQYLRYWHGSIAIVRPLLTMMSVRGMYILNAVILIILLTVLMIMLIRQHEPAPAVGILLGAVLTAWWFVPMCLEYTWVCSLAVAACIAVTRLFCKSKSSIYGAFFMVVGMMTNYLDFLTTETLTMLMPLLLLIWYDRKGKRVIKTAIEGTVSWGVGYCGMWVLKWILTAIVFNEDVIPYVKWHIDQRLDGGHEELSLIRYMTGAIYRNILCMFPAGYGISGLIIATVLFIIFAFLGIKFCRKDYDKELICVLASLGALPFVRYLVLHNHSYGHYFFTYRALAASVFAAVLILGELTGFDPADLIHRNKKLKVH